MNLVGYPSLDGAENPRPPHSRGVNPSSLYGFVRIGGNEHPRVANHPRTGSQVHARPDHDDHERTRHPRTQDRPRFHRPSYPWGLGRCVRRGSRRERLSAEWVPLRRPSTTAPMSWIITEARPSCCPTIENRPSEGLFSSRRQASRRCWERILDFGLMVESVISASNPRRQRLGHRRLVRLDEFGEHRQSRRR